mgnify:CR=1 FL=1
MGTALFLVIFSQHAWWVDFEGEAHGPFDTLEAAALEGREMARMTAHSGRRSQLLCPDTHGRYHVVWSSLRESQAA